MDMIRKLRWRFIAISMASLFAVLLIIMGIANVLNYQSVVRGADETLELLLEYNGVFPEFQNLTPGNRPDGQIPVRPEDDHDEDDDFDDLFDRDDDDSHTDLRLVGRRGGRTFSEETPYSSRYFTVIFDQAGAIQSVNTDRIFAVDEDEAETFATKALATHKSSGFLDVYRFAAKNSDGSTIVVFLDCEERLSTFHNFLLTSVAISVGGMLAVFLLMLLLSKRIVRPFIDNYEKQKRFITDAGHEIKTPIAVIQADTEVLEMDLGEDNEWLHDIQTQTEKLTSLTNDLVMLSRMEEAGRNIQMIEFPFSDVVTEAAGSFKALALTQNKTFETDIEPMLSLTGDEKAVRQLVSILLDNAVKYCPEGGDICLSAKSTGKSITLSTYNSSAPVEKESLKHIFDRFYRLDSSRNAKTGGYGIGLSIARAVMEAHKGKIEATTKDGTSVTITATFPVK